MMQAYFQFHSKLESFHIFSLEHILTIGLILSLCFFIFVFRSKLKEKGKQRLFRFSLTILLLVTDLLYHLWLLYEKAWNVKKDLPLQLSDFAVILAIIMLMTKNYKLFQFMYFAGLGSSIQAIITPDLGKFSFPHFRYIEFFASHGGVVLACLFMVVLFNFRPNILSMWVTILIVNLYAAFVYFLNKMLGANYLYLISKPRNTSLLDYLGPWPWYLFSMELVMILSFYILYIPFFIKAMLNVIVDI